MIKEDDIVRFYEFLNHKEETEVRLIDPQRIKPALSFFVHNKYELLDVCREYNGKYNVYAGLNERIKNGKDDVDVISITNIGHDVDCHGDVSVMPKAKEITEEYLGATRATNLNEALVLCSGRGYWIIHNIAPIEPTIDNKAKIKLWANSIKRMFEQSGVEFDPAVYNFSRIARIPGTLNISDPNNKVLSYIVNNPKERGDELFRKKILDIKLPEYKDVAVCDIPKGNCAFMDYCLNNKLPTGERHLIISRNMSLYIFNRPDIEALKQRYITVQEGSIGELDNWLRSINEHPNIKYPFSCEQLIKYQYKNNIPLQCLNCALYKSQNELSEPRGWACSINIKKMAENNSFTKCPICNNEFNFNERLGFYRCNNCKIYGGIKMFAELISKNR